MTGEAGFGKTSLCREFARQAQVRHSELLVANGNCNAQTGIADPYLPFREILELLTGEGEERLASGAVTQENAWRLQRFWDLSRRVVSNVAPDLIDLFVPGIRLAARAGALVATESGWLKPAAPARDGRAPTVLPGSLAASVEQTRIFEQATAALNALAQERPLVLILDDLHWIDDSSSSLLFHISRRIAGSRVLLLGNFRPKRLLSGAMVADIRWRR